LPNEHSDERCVERFAAFPQGRRAALPHVQGGARAARARGGIEICEEAEARLAGPPPPPLKPCHEGGKAIV